MGFLDWRPSEFWASTPFDVDAAIEGRRRKAKMEAEAAGKAPPEPMSALEYNRCLTDARLAAQSPTQEHP